MKMMSWAAGEGPSLCRRGTALALVALVIALPACQRRGPAEGQPARGQSTFASPQDAGKALVDAAGSGNEQQMMALFGPQNKDLIFTGNPAEDKAAFAQFASAYHRLNRWRQLENGSEVLLVGVSNTAFAIPLRKDTSGKWFFDTTNGKSELFNRSIGRNELAAIDILASLVDAQTEYFNQAHDGTKQYARKFISDPGKQDGLYWPLEAGKAKSPVGPLLAYASAQGAKVQPGLHKPFHGYYFGILLTQGPFANGGLRDYVRNGVMNRGFGIVAYPAQYGVSGVMTFIIDQDRVVFEKDLGETTNNQAPFMTQFGPDASWSEVKQ
jgi:hypothetical protein